MPKSRLSALLSLLIVFLSGSVLGAFVYRLYATSSVVSKDPNAGAPPHKMGPEEFRRNYVSNLSKAVKLDDKQLGELNAILDQIRDEVAKLRDKIRPEQESLDEKWRPEREAIHARQIARINAMLRPDQRPLYDAFRAERERLHKQREQQHKKQ